MRYETEKAYSIYDAEAEREHGPSGDCEVYYREGSDQMDEISITTNEREDFEQEEGVELIADVVPVHVFEKMLAYLKLNGLLHEEV